MHEVAAFDVADVSRNRLEQCRCLLAQLVTLSCFLTVRQQPHGRLGEAIAKLRVRASHARELHEPVGGRVDGRARVDEQLVVIAGHGDRDGDRRSRHTADPPQAQERRRHRRSGIARADHRGGVAVSHGVGAPHDRRVLAGAHRPRGIVIHSNDFARVEQLHGRVAVELARAGAAIRQHECGRVLLGLLADQGAEREPHLRDRASRLKRAA